MWRWGEWLPRRHRLYQFLETRSARWNNNVLTKPVIEQLPPSIPLCRHQPRLFSKGFQMIMVAYGDILNAQAMISSVQKCASNPSPKKLRLYFLESALLHAVSQSKRFH